ncbi:EAL domain-containing protein [Nitrincola sp. MINF-07-Sa-05]|uniref:EAL domain-containing protein n=1 Tax=Nitrincola salilacus TaxID=3400273 RepID=UPI003917E04B
MSLIKQLWIAVIILMTIAFFSSLSISIFSARQYFEEQLHLKNIDNANSLGLTLSQLEKDPVTIELLLAAQFDTGHYQFIELVDPEGEVIQRKQQEGASEYTAPDWFIRIAPLNVDTGVALVQDGWNQYGVLRLESHTRFAHEALWTTTKELLLSFFVVAFGCGLLGTLILKMITRPLDDVVLQAEAIGGRRFITSHEPRTLEFGRVVRAMNILSERIRHMLDVEARRLEDMRFKNQHDSVTELPNREYFLNLLDAQLTRDDAAGHGSLFMVRLSHLAEINKSLGYKQTDQLLCAIADLIKEATAKHADAFGGRLNGSDFALLIPGNDDLVNISDELVSALRRLAEGVTEDKVYLPLSACCYVKSESRGVVLMRGDNALAIAEQREDTCAEIIKTTGTEEQFQSADKWREALEYALETLGVRIHTFSVKSPGGEVIHDEAMMRLELNGELRSAGYFIPWAKRLNLMPRLDLAVAAAAIDRLKSGASEHLAVNLSVEAISDAGFRRQLVEQLKEVPDLCYRIWLELPEKSVLNSLEAFRDFCMVIKPLGVKIGMERAGAGFSEIGELQDLGLDYIKVDSAFVRDLPDNVGNQNFVRGLATVAHSIGMLVIAEGVQTEQEIAALRDCGVDAMTGPIIG